MITLRVLDSKGHVALTPVCDACQEPISDLGDGNVLFSTDYTIGPVQNALTVHKACDRRQLRQWVQLDHVLGSLQLEAVAR